MLSSPFYKEVNIIGIGKLLYKKNKLRTKMRKMIEIKRSLIRDKERLKHKFDEFVYEHVKYWYKKLNK